MDSDSGDEPDSKPAAADDGKPEELFKEEEERQKVREAAIDASWTKHVLTPGSGPLGTRGARATVHVLGRLGSASGAVFEDTRARGVPLILLLGRAAVVPGLDRALLAMKAGETARVIVEPDGGYGAAGNIAHPRVPGSTTLVFVVELLALEEELELWDLSFEQKLVLARERRERGKTLFVGSHFAEADAEFEQVASARAILGHVACSRHVFIPSSQAMRYLVFMPEASDDERATLEPDLIAVCSTPRHTQAVPCPPPHQRNRFGGASVGE